jgi:hypothetical protein
MYRITRLDYTAHRYPDINSQKVEIEISEKLIIALSLGNNEYPSLGCCHYLEKNSSRLSPFPHPSCLWFVS